MTHISIIVPIYNSKETIGACVNSILSQTYSDIELVLVDDGCKDGSGAICDEFACADKRVKVIHQSNRGRTEARAVGVSNSCGEWIGFVDSDDTIPPQALALLLGKASDDVDIIFGNGYTLDHLDEDKDVVPIDEFRHKTVRGEGTIGVPWGSLYRRTLLTPYAFNLPREIINGEDYIFWLRIIFNTVKPIAIVFDSVYDKGKEHTSNDFVWTAEYSYKINEYRIASIPQDQLHLYMRDAIEDRMANMAAVAYWQDKREWITSKFYVDLMHDMACYDMHYSLVMRIYMMLPSLTVRKYCSKLRNWLSKK